MDNRRGIILIYFMLGNNGAPVDLLWLPESMLSIVMMVAAFCPSFLPYWQFWPRSTLGHSSDWLGIGLPIRSIKIANPPDSHPSTRAMRLILGTLVCLCAISRCNSQNSQVPLSDLSLSVTTDQYLSRAQKLMKATPVIDGHNVPSHAYSSLIPITGFTDADSIFSEQLDILEFLIWRESHWRYRYSSSSERIGRRTILVCVCSLVQRPAMTNLRVVLGMGAIFCLVYELSLGIS